MKISEIETLGRKVRISDIGDHDFVIIDLYGISFVIQYSHVKDSLIIRRPKVCQLIDEADVMCEIYRNNGEVTIPKNEQTD